MPISVMSLLKHNGCIRSLTVGSLNIRYFTSWEHAIDRAKIEKASEYCYLEASGMSNGADCRIRTDDLPLTRRLLYQLS